MTEVVNIAVQHVTNHFLIKVDEKVSDMLVD